MQTDTKDPCDDALDEQALPQSSSEAALMPDEVDALMAMLKVMTIYELYNAYLVEHVKPHAIRHLEDRTSSPVSSIACARFDGLRVLALVWKESNSSPSRTSYAPDFAACAPIRRSSATRSAAL